MLDFDKRIVKNLLILSILPCYYEVLINSEVDVLIEIMIDLDLSRLAKIGSLLKR